MIPKYNKYTPNDIIKHPTKGYAEIVIMNYKTQKEKGRGIIDVEDIRVAKKHKWYIRRSGYCATRIKAKIIFLHHLLINKGKNQVDHINRNRLDNRKSNLRTCTHRQNCHNKIITNNKSGFMGVQKRGNLWRARIQINKKHIHLGYYKEKNEAKEARLNAEKKYYGIFAPVREEPNEI